MELAEALTETLAVELAEALAGATVELAETIAGATVELAVELAGASSLATGKGPADAPKEGWPAAVTRWWPAKSYDAQ